MSDSGPPEVQPLDLWCNACGAAPDICCVWTAANGAVASRKPHACRVTAARLATMRLRKRARQQQERSPSSP